MKYSFRSFYTAPCLCYTRGCFQQAMRPAHFTEGSDFPNNHPCHIVLRFVFPLRSNYEWTLNLFPIWTPSLFPILTFPPSRTSNKFLSASSVCASWSDYWRLLLPPALTMFPPLLTCVDPKMNGYSYVFSLPIVGISYFSHLATATPCDFFLIPSFVFQGYSSPHPFLNPT